MAMNGYKKDPVTGVTEISEELSRITDVLKQKKEMFFAEADREKFYTAEDLEKERIRLLLSSHFMEIVIAAGFVLSMLHSVLYLFRMARGIYTVNCDAIPISIAGGVIFTLFPVGLWIASTYFDEFNYENRKLMLLWYCIVNLFLYLENVMQHFLTLMIVPLMLKIPITQFVTKSMVINLTRLLVGIVPILICGFWIAAMIKFTQTDSIEEEILYFRIKDHYDFRKNQEYKYDAKFIRHLDSGDIFVIKQEDRTLHTMIDGTTGTGKTSGCITVSVADDLDQKVFNETHQKKELEELMKAGDVTLKKTMSDKDFFLGNFTCITEHGKAVIKELQSICPTAGLTVMSPNDGLADEIYELAKSRGLRVNRLDPTLDPVTFQKKEGYIGFNPLYISPTLSPMMRNLEIVKKARVFADVMQALYEMNGKGDPYFMSLNRNITTCITILVLVTYPFLHKESPQKYPDEHPTLAIVQDVINDFGKVLPYTKKLEYIIKNMTAEERGFEDNTFSFVLDLVKNDLLGEGKEKMFDQSRGLRVMINEFLTNPLYKDALCSQNSIDMDRMLERGEITIVNYALELGRADAVAFGLFFALSFNNAVLRRPKSTRIPHFYYVDEFPILLHSSMEECFTLFRQYNVSMCVAMQTLDQMNKSDTTMYLRGVLQGNCAHQILFGRVSVTEMRLYEELGGTRKEMVEQETISETALSDPATSMSFSTRTTPTDVSVISGGRMRNLHFQEVTVFSVNQGSPLRPFFGKVSFLSEDKRLKVERYSVDWNRLKKSEPEDTADSIKNTFTSCNTSDGKEEERENLITITGCVNVAPLQPDKKSASSEPVILQEKENTPFLREMGDIRLSSGKEYATPTFDEQNCSFKKEQSILDASCEQENLSDERNDEDLVDEDEFFLGIDMDAAEIVAYYEEGEE